MQTCEAPRIHDLALVVLSAARTCCDFSEGVSQSRKLTAQVDGYQGDDEDGTDAQDVIQGMENVVMDSIEHADPPTMIDEQEAAAISDVQHAYW